MVTVITFDQFDDPQGEAGVHIMYTSVEYYACGMHRYMYMFVLKSALAVEQHKIHPVVNQSSQSSHPVHTVAYSSADLATACLVNDSTSLDLKRVHSGNSTYCIA